MKPVLFLTGHAPPDRIGAFAALHELENVEFALFGGPSKHATAEVPGERLAFPHKRVTQRASARLITSGRYRAVVVSTGGRAALPLCWAAARRADVPLILWSSLWAHPRSVAHAFSYPALRRLYRSADAVVTYGPHVSAYVKARGARNVHVAAQAVDNTFWGSPDTSPPTHGAWPEGTAVKFLFAGRPSREKGIQVLLRAWRASGLTTSSAALVLVGVRSVPPWIHVGGAADTFQAKVICAGELDPVAVRNFYGAADVLVLPSIATRTFREPWGLVINEAMNQHLPVIASDAVGAVAGGLVRPSHNGLVVAAGDVAGLAGAMKRLAEDPRARVRLGEQGARDVQAYTYQAWARGFSEALDSLHLSRGGW